MRTLRLMEVTWLSWVAQLVNDRARLYFMQSAPEPCKPEEHLPSTQTGPPAH